MDNASNATVLGFPEYPEQAQALADGLGVDCAIADVHRFPDGESLVCLPPTLPPRLVVCRSLDYPNDKLVELALTAATARAMGVQTLTLMAPYLCYMRQDKAFHPGEAVSQFIIGRQLAGQFDEVITVDPHLHRTPRMEQAVPAKRALALTSAGLIGTFISRQFDTPVLLGPDSESEQWARAVAQSCGCEYGIAHKDRRGDRDVEVALPPLDLAGRQVVLVDDVASTGRTLAGAARQARERGAADVQAVVVHALFVDDALEHLQRAGVSAVWSTDSIRHPSNAIALQPLLTQALAASRESTDS